MFEHADFVSWALAAVGFGYGVWVDSLARKRLGSVLTQFTE
jgi:hypothetical protein